LVNASVVFVLAGLIFIGYRVIVKWNEEKFFSLEPLIIPFVLTIALLNQGAALKTFVSSARTAIIVVDSQILRGVGEYTAAREEDAKAINLIIAADIKKKALECQTLNTPENRPALETCFNQLKILANQNIPKIVNDDTLASELTSIANKTLDPGVDVGAFFQGIGRNITGAAADAFRSVVSLVLKALGIAWSFVIEFVLLLLAIVSPLFISASFLIGNSFFIWLGLFYAVALAKWSFTLMTVIVVIFSAESRLSASSGDNAVLPFVLELISGIGSIFVSAAIALGAFNSVDKVLNGKSAGTSGLLNNSAVSAAGSAGGAFAGKAGRAAGIVGGAAGKAIGSSRAAKSIASSRAGIAAGRAGRAVGRAAQSAKGLADKIRRF
jgi:hypothetical protein